MTKTTFASPRLKKLGDPYPPPKPITMFVDTTKLTICTDPLPAGRAIINGKYDDIFKSMKPGEAIKCEPASVQRIRGAMVKFVKVRGIKGIVVKTMRDYGDGMGRVWMLSEPAKKLKVAA